MAVAAAACGFVVVTAFAAVVASVDAVATDFVVAGVLDCAITLLVADAYDVEEI